MDQEAITAASAALPDESLQSAPAGSATTQASAPAPSQAQQPATAAPNADSAPAQDPPAGEQPPNPDAQPQSEPAKKRNGTQTRIDELTRQRYEAIREAEHWKQQAQAKAQAPAQPEAPEPRIEEFQDINAFFKARDKWVADQVKAEIRRDSEQAAQQQAARQQQDQQVIAVQQAVERFAAQELDARDRHQDYDATVGSPLMQQFKQARPDVARVVIDSPHGADIAYFLGKNPAQAQQIASLSPIAAAREIGRIEQMFMQPKAQATNAPPPPRTVGNNAAVERAPKDMGNEEYRKWRRQSGKR